MKKRTKERLKQLEINNNFKRKFMKTMTICPCYYCKDVFLVINLTIEHIIPLSLGGSNNDDNIALACGPCNQKRGRESWLARKKSKRLKYEQYSSQYLS